MIRPLKKSFFPFFPISQFFGFASLRFAPLRSASLRFATTQLTFIIQKNINSLVRSVRELLKSDEVVKNDVNRLIRNDFPELR